jgi:hypothetical protein
MKIKGQITCQDRVCVVPALYKTYLLTILIRHWFGIENRDYYPAAGFPSSVSLFVLPPCPPCPPCPSFPPWLSALVVRPGCPPWLSALVIRLGCPPWLSALVSALVVRPSCPPWLSALIIRPGCLPWSSALVVLVRPGWL